MKNYLKLMGQVALLTGVFINISCSDANHSKEAGETTETDFVELTSGLNIHAAFAGGGWRAHTGHTASLAAYIKPGQNTLGDVLGGYKTISSNSGGSWFSTMAMYDAAFNSKMNAGASDFWLRSQKTAFTKKQPTACLVSNITECIISEQYSLNWRNFVQGVVYSGSSITAADTLSTSPMAWATDKPLLLAGAMLTHDAVLDGTHLGDKSYNWACPNGSTPYLENSPVFGSKDGDKGGRCSPMAIVPDVIPVTFSNRQAQSVTSNVPTFLKGASSSYEFGYSKNSLSASPLNTATISNPLSSKNVGVIDAASASSAAAGYAASLAVAGFWIEAFEVENLSVNFSLNGGVTRIDPLPSFSDLSTQKVVKIADGGVVDNTGVAQLMSFLQETNQDQDFIIVSYDSYLVSYKKESNGNWTTTKYGKDGLSDGMRYLIGDLPTPNPYSFDDYKIRLPDLQIFDVTAKSNVSETTFANPSCPQNGSGDGATGNFFVQVLSVKTRDNAAFHIKNGSQGLIIVLSTENSAPTEPENLNSFKCYNEMLTSMKARPFGKTVLQMQLEELKQSSSF